MEANYQRLKEYVETIYKDDLYLRDLIENLKHDELSTRTE